MPSIVCEGITYPFPNFNSCIIEVGEWISNFIPQYIMGVVAYPCCIWRLLTVMLCQPDKTRGNSPSYIYGMRCFFVSPNSYLYTITVFTVLYAIILLYRVVLHWDSGLYHVKIMSNGVLTLANSSRQFQSIPPHECMRVSYNCWSLEFHPTHYIGCNYLPKLAKEMHIPTAVPWAVTTGNPE